MTMQQASSNPYQKFNGYSAGTNWSQPSAGDNVDDPEKQKERRRQALLRRMSVKPGSMP